MRWYQISGRFRMVACLPEGKTGKQALLEASDNPSYRQLPESHAGDQYLRVYAPKEQRRTLDLEEWADFKDQGGTTYLSAHWRNDV